MSLLRAVLVGAGGMGQAWARHRQQAMWPWWAGPTYSKSGSLRALKRSGFPTGIEQDVEAALTDCRRTLSSMLPSRSPPRDHPVFPGRRVAVLGEKPMAANLDEARDLVRVSERTSTLVVVSQNRRYNAGFKSFKLLAADRLGGIGQLNAEFYRAPHFGGFREEMDSPLLIDMAIHTFDAARHVTGADPVSVLCTEFNPPWSWYRGAASAVVEFELTGGIRFSYEGSWCADGLETSWDSSWRAVGESRERQMGWHRPPRRRGAPSRGRRGPVRAHRSWTGSYKRRWHSGVAGRLRPGSADRCHPDERVPRQYQELCHG